MDWFKCNNDKRSTNYTTSKNLYDKLNGVSNTLYGLGVKMTNNITGAEKDSDGNITAYWYRLFSTKSYNFEVAANNIHNVAGTMINDILPLIKSYRDSLQSIGAAIEKFDKETKTNLSDVIDDDGGTYTVTDENGVVYDFSIETVDGAEIIYYDIKLDDGTTTKVSIDELVNSLFTYEGITMSSIYSAGLMTNGILDDGDVKDIVSRVNAFNDNLLFGGAFGVSSLEDIEGVKAKYNVSMEDVENLKLKIDELDVHDVGSVVEGTVGPAAAILSAYTLTDYLNKEMDVPGVGETKTSPSATPTTPPTPSTTPPTPSTTTQPPTTTTPTDTTGITTEPVTTAPVPTNPEDDDRLVQVDPDIKIPEVQTEPEIKPEDLDDLAREEYYNKYDPDSLADHQAEMLRQYENLYNEQDRDKLIDMFKEMGYNDAEAIAAANNRDIGQSAFLLGMQNKELTDIANSFAEEYGLTEGFDTSYDDTPDFADLYDGDAQASLTAPYDSDAIMEAKENVTEAKDAYIESVATANTSIGAATEAKENMNEVRASIEAKSGTDTSKWTEEDIAKYNEATEKYNTAVTKANEDAAAAEAAKATYDAAKESLEQAEDDYYDKIRKGVQTQGGTQPGQDTPQGNTPQQNVGGNVPETGVTNTGNTTGNNEEENNTGNTSNDPFSEDMMNAFMGSK